MSLRYFLKLFLVCLELNYEIPCADNLLNTVITTSAVTLRMFTTAWKQANCGGFPKTPPPSTPFSFDKQFPNLRQYLESRQLFRRHNHHQQHQEMLPFQKKSKPSLPVMIRTKGGLLVLRLPHLNSHFSHDAWLDEHVLLGHSACGCDKNTF